MAMATAPSPARPRAIRATTTRSSPAGIAVPRARAKRRQSRKAPRPDAAGALFLCRDQIGENAAAGGCQDRFRVELDAGLKRAGIADRHCHAVDLRVDPEALG